MQEIIIVASGHGQIGKLNSNNLYKIIEFISPDIIFEEISPSKFGPVYDGTLNDSLETFTIKKYLEKHSIQHYPVDMEIDSIVHSKLRNKVSQLFDKLDNYSIEYKRVDIDHRKLVEIYGFKYLNSNHCISILRKKEKLKFYLLKKINQSELFDIYIEWSEMLKKRENTMIETIYRYHQNINFDKGIFIVGAAHISSILEILNNFKNKKFTQIFKVYNPK